MLIIVAFSVLYVIVPNAKVRLRPALAGGLFAGITWAASGQVFTGIVVAASRWEAIYSGFAIVIIVMIWMRLSWLILLLGAQLAFYLQHPEYLRLGQRTVTTANGLRERLALTAMLMVGRDFDAPAHGWRAESLAARIRVPRHLLDPVITALRDAGLLTATTGQRLIPRRDPRRIGLLEILSAVRSWSSDQAADDDRDWDPTIAALAQQIDDAIAAAVENRSLADLVDQDRAGDSAMDLTGPPP
jgi:membrane protein